MRLPQSATAIPLLELPQWSPWPARLLGLTEWKNVDRTIGKVDSEYDKDKYAKCLQFVEQKKGKLTVDDVKREETGGNMGQQICVSVKDDLFVMPLREVLEQYFVLYEEVMGDSLRQAEVLVELGCGYGYNLWHLRDLFPDKTYIGGEYSANAVRIAGQLFAEIPEIRVEQFNFYQEEYGLLRKALERGKTVVFTSHAIEQLPSAAAVARGICACADGNLLGVFHFEPGYELHDETLLGMMRRRYAEVNDYNRDLHSILTENDAINIIREEADVFGSSPLNPTSVTHWRMRT